MVRQGTRTPLRAARLDVVGPGDQGWRFDALCLFPLHFQCHELVGALLSWIDALVDQGLEPSCLCAGIVKVPCTYIPDRLADGLPVQFRLEDVGLGAGRGANSETWRVGVPEKPLLCALGAVEPTYAVWSKAFALHGFLVATWWLHDGSM